MIFILLQRRDLRDRFIGLIGSDDLHRTTKALDDAAQRLSRYFLALTGINASFGIIIGLGLSPHRRSQSGPLGHCWRCAAVRALRRGPYRRRHSARARRGGRSRLEHGRGNRSAFRRCRKHHGPSGGAAVVRPHHRNVAARHHCRGRLLDPHMGRAGTTSFDADHGVPGRSGPACRKSQFHRAASRRQAAAVAGSKLLSAHPRR